MRQNPKKVHLLRASGKVTEGLHQQTQRLRPTLANDATNAADGFFASPAAVRHNLSPNSSPIPGAEDDRLDDDTLAEQLRYAAAGGSVDLTSGDGKVDLTDQHTNSPVVEIITTNEHDANAGDPPNVVATNAITIVALRLIQNGGVRM